MYQQHPLSAAFPAMGPDEFQALKDSIVDLGVQNPVTLFEGMVLDGWHRYCAAIELGMECPEQELEDWIDPRSFVKAQNKHRRHLSVGAWALIEVSLYKFQWALPHRPNKGAPGAPLSRTREDMASSAGSSVRTIIQAKNVDAKAVPAVKRAVLSGQASLKEAEQIAKLPADQQEKALAVAIAPKPRSTSAQVAPGAGQLEPPPDEGPSAEEMAAHAAAEAADRELVAKLLDSNEPLAALVAENKQLKAEIAQLKMARDSYMKRCNEAIALVKARDRQIAKLEKLVGAPA